MAFRQTAGHLLQEAETAALPQGSPQKVLPTKSHNPAKPLPPLGQIAFWYFIWTQGQTIYIWFTNLDYLCFCTFFTVFIHICLAFFSVVLVCTCVYFVYFFFTCCKVFGTISILTIVFVTTVLFIFTLCNVL